MITESKKTGVTLALSVCAFVVFVAYILFINQEVFFTAHERSEFLPGTTFLYHLLAYPFGLMQYVGAWFAQFFFYPALGSALLAAIWVLIFWIGKKAFRLDSAASALMLLPVACLLTSVVDLGYWVYVSTIRGYWFSQSVAFLIMLLLLWAARSTPRQWHLCWYLLGICLYPVLGWYALLFVLCLIITDKLSWPELIGFILLLFTANIWRELLYSSLNLDQVLLAGLPRFVTASDKTDHLTAPFWVLGAVSIIIPLCYRFLNRWFVPMLCTIAGIAFTSSLMYHDQTYVDEMRMARAAADENWAEVLTIADENSVPTSSMIILKNIALMNEGGLLDRSFKIGNISYPAYNPDSIHTSFLEIAAPVAYYNYGLLNEAFRLSFECAVQSGFSPYYLKMLARCATANGEDKLAKRYITTLHTLPYYSDWQPAAVNEKIIELHNSYSDEITGVENSDGYLVTSICEWKDTENKLAAEQAVLYSMIRRDSHAFWPSLRSFIKTHLGEEFPVHVIEAYILYYDKAPEAKKMRLPVSQELFNRYNAFWATLGELIQSGKSKDAAGQEMYSEYGDTYWYYNIFSRRIY